MIKCQMRNQSFVLRLCYQSFLVIRCMCTVNGQIHPLLNHGHAIAEGCQPHIWRRTNKDIHQTVTRLILWNLSKQIIQGLTKKWMKMIQLGITPQATFCVWNDVGPQSWDLASGIIGRKPRSGQMQIYMKLKIFNFDIYLIILDMKNRNVEY